MSKTTKTLDTFRLFYEELTAIQPKRVRVRRPRANQSKRT